MLAIAQPRMSIRRLKRGSSLGVELCRGDESFSAITAHREPRRYVAGKSESGDDPEQDPLRKFEVAVVDRLAADSQHQRPRDPLDQKIGGEELKNRAFGWDPITQTEKKKQNGGAE